MREFFFLLLVAFLGNTASRLMRVGSAFATLNEGWSFLAFLAASFAFGRLISSFLGGELTKKLGSKTASLGLASLGAVGLGYSYLPSSFYPYLRVLHGLSAGFTWPAVQALAMSKVERGFRGRASSLYFFSGNLAWFFAFALGGALGKASSLPSSVILFALALAVLRVKGVAKKEKVKRKGGFAPPLTSIILSSLGLGMMTVMVNTEVAIATFGGELGKVWGGLTLATAALVGSGISYFLNKKLIDVMESDLSLVLPPLASSLPGTLMALPAPASVLGLFVAKAGTMWWRSAVLGLARSGDVGRRVGAFNASGDAGRLLGSLISSAGPQALPALPLTALALGLAAWLHTRSTLSTSSAE